MKSILQLILAVLPLGAAVPLDGHQSPQASASSTAPYLCNFAKITVPSASRSAIVHAHPRSGSSQRDRLPSGQVVYVCDETRYWYQIFYGPSGTPCGSSATDSLDVREARKCKSGWISSRWVDVLSG